MAADGSGHAYVIGITDNPSVSGFATTSGAFATTAYTHETGFLRIYDTAASGAASLTYSTFVGGSQNGGGNVTPGLTDSPTGVAVSGGKVAIVGTTDTSNFPTTSDAIASTAHGSTGFLIVLDPQGGGSNDLVYGSYYGSGLDMGAVAWSGNNIYLVGSTTTSTGLSTPDAFQPGYAGGRDGLVAVFSGFGNTAPVLNGANDLPAQLEDAAAGAGTLVADLVAGHVSDDHALAGTGIAITALDSANGTWQYSTNGTTWTAMSTPAAGNALLLAADGQTRVRFVPAAVDAGSASITFRAWDRSAFSAGTVVTVATTGGVTAFSAATATASVTVTPVNDRPVRTGAITGVTVVEGGPARAIGPGSLGYGPGGGADEAGQVLTYTITGLPTGVVSITHADGTAVVAGESFTLAEVHQQLWSPLAAATAEVSYTDSDDCGTANGGQDSLAQSATIVITNAAPVLTGANALPAQLEDTPARARWWPTWSPANSPTPAAVPASPSRRPTLPTAVGSTAPTAAAPGTPWARSAPPAPACCLPTP